MKYFASSLAVCVALCASRTESQTFTTLITFTGTGGTASGANPFGSLIASDGTLYGMTRYGGTEGDGNIFSVGMNGTDYQNLISFTGYGGTASGKWPTGSLVASGGTLYGMTYLGGNGYGNILSVGMNGTNYQNLVSFTGYGGTASGAFPLGSLIVVGGKLYGMTSEYSANGYGNLFSVGTNDTNYQDLVSFTGSGGTASGQYPQLGSLLASGGTVYGMTQSGGGNGDGNVFSVGTNGTNYQDLVSFTGTGGTASGAFPQGSLIDSGSTLYGTTFEGGASGLGTVFSVGVNGTNYQNLVSFTGTGGTASGDNPVGSLILAGTTLYGMTLEGGVHGYGTVFSVGINGSGYEDLYDFTGATDGAYPYGDLLASGGTLFGMTSEVGATAIGDGTVFALSAPGLVPEPSTLALAGAGGAAALVSYRWRRRRRGIRAAGRRKKRR